MSQESDAEHLCICARECERTSASVPQPFVSLEIPLDVSVFTSRFDCAIVAPEPTQLLIALFRCKTSGRSERTRIKRKSIRAW